MRSARDHEKRPTAGIVGRGAPFRRRSDMRPPVRAADRVQTSSRAAEDGCAVYLSDFIVVEGAGGLLAQKARIEAYVRGTGHRAPRCFVDAGWLDPGAPFGPALLELARHVQAGSIDVVIVEHLGRFSDDGMSALRAAMALSQMGACVHEARVGAVEARGADALRGVLR